MTLRRRIFTIFLAAVLICGCEGQTIDKRAGGALAGGTLGAGLGAIVGSQVGHGGAGVAIGAGLGALSGLLIGNEMKNKDDAAALTDEQLARQEKELEENRRLIDELKSRGADVHETSRGVVVNLPDVLFDFGSARLTSEARNTAADIAGAVKQSGSARKISVEGHTDSIGTAEYNQRLSVARAQSVADELAHEGVSRGHIRTRGFGENDPIASNKTESGRQRNRRVEVIIENSSERR